MLIGFTMSGSLATNSMRKPGGKWNIRCSSCGVCGGVRAIKRSASSRANAGAAAMMIATATAERIVRRKIRESESDLYDMLARTFDDPDACTIDRANSAIKCESANSQRSDPAIRCPGHSLSTAELTVDCVVASTRERGYHRRSPKSSPRVASWKVGGLPCRVACRSCPRGKSPRQSASFSHSPLAAALVVLDPHTGWLKAMVGGRDYGRSQLNHALAKRQPGSSFKPFVYAAALNSGVDGSQPLITPATMLNDEPTTFQFGDTTYEPENYKQEYFGQVTLRTALMHSLNVATVSLAEMVGYEKVRNLALAAGFNQRLAGHARHCPGIVCGDAAGSRRRLHDFFQRRNLRRAAVYSGRQ